MITIYDAILICFGINFLTREINRFEKVSTAMTATPIPSAFITEVVVARVGHIPRSWTNVGLFVMMPSFICFPMGFFIELAVPFRCIPV